MLAGRVERHCELRMDGMGLFGGGGRAGGLQAVGTRVPWRPLGTAMPGFAGCRAVGVGLRMSSRGSGRHGRNQDTRGACFVLFFFPLHSVHFYLFSFGLISGLGVRA